MSDSRGVLVFALSFGLRTGRCGATLAGSLGVLVALTGCGGHDASHDSSGSAHDPGLSPSASGPSADPAAVKPISVPASELRRARSSTSSYVAAVSSVLAKPAALRTHRPPAGSVAGRALAQLKSQAAELASNGQHLAGRPRVVRVTVTRRTKSPAAMTVAACLDNSPVQVINRSGHQVPRSPSARRHTLNLLELVQRNGKWVVTDQTFPADPDC